MSFALNLVEMHFILRVELKNSLHEEQPVGLQNEDVYVHLDLEWIHGSFGHFPFGHEWNPGYGNFGK